MHALHCASGPYRHEGGRPYHAMRRPQPAGARCAVDRDKIKMTGKAHARLLRDNDPGFNLVEANPCFHLDGKHVDGR
jgi:hypothetical protein